MTASNGTNNANGIISLIVLACGITFSALIGGIVNKAVEANQEFDEGTMQMSKGELESSLSISTAPLWCFGFGFMIPGVLGVIGAFVKNKGLYITQMVFCIISLLVMGIFFIVAVLGLEALAMVNPSMEECHDVGGKCVCLDSDTPLAYSCGDLKSMYGMGVGFLIIIVLGWILLLTATVLAGILACRQEATPGVIMRPPMTTTVVQMAPVAGMAPGMAPPQITYMPQVHPQVHDQAQLVHNMEY